MTIYLDYNATTPVDERVVESMLPYLRDDFANAASTQHAPGRIAADAVERSREQVAHLMDCEAREVVFTSGATEANNLILRGLAARGKRGGRTRIIVGATEHKSVLDVADHLADEGFVVERAPVNADGRLALDAYVDLLGEDVAFVSLMAANSETGALHPLDEVVRQAHQVGALVHSDVTQRAGKLPLDLNTFDIDCASLSAHKIYGPKGVGAAIVKRQFQRDLPPLIYGGGHERGLRSGTSNVPGIVGFGTAAELAGSELFDDATKLRALTECLWQALADHIGGVTINGPQPEQRLPNTVNVRFDGLDAEALMVNAPNVAVSSGSACTSAVPAPSHVLLAMGLDHEAAEQSLRFSLGRRTSTDEIDTAVSELAAAASRLRDLVGVEQTQERAVTDAS